MSNPDEQLNRALKALQLARTYIAGNMIEHAIVYMDGEILDPHIGLGRWLDIEIAELSGTKPPPREKQDRFADMRDADWDENQGQQ